MQTVTTQQSPSGWFTLVREKLQRTPKSSYPENVSQRLSLFAHISIMSMPTWMDQVTT